MTDLLEGFEPFPKIGRLNRDCTITEKLDGTNAQIEFDPAGNMMVGSRKRQIWPEGTVFIDEKVVKGTDNMGFAAWAYSLKDALFEFLGPGRHYGEWAGLGIQRSYGLKEKRFYLFNTFRWKEIPDHMSLLGLDVVPTIYTGPFTTDTINTVVHNMRFLGSSVNDFPRPEGIIIYHHGLRTYAKVTLEKDDSGKGKDDQSPS